MIKLLYFRNNLNKTKNKNKEIVKNEIFTEREQW